MRILIFSVIPLPLLDRLGEYLAGAGHDVINLAGKRSRGRSSQGVRRIIMNFDEGGRADDLQEAWKRAIKNGSFGLKALNNLAASWQPDLIFCRSGQGAAFFIRDVFPAAFLCGFAADSHESGIAVELDSRLYLQSCLRFAPDNRAIAKFPQLLREAIELEPICVDADFFQPGMGGPFSCWKLTGASHIIGIALAGLEEGELQFWVRTLAEALMEDKGMGVVALTDKGGVASRLVRVMDAMPGKIGERFFAADHFERDAWRDLCASIPVVFTSQSQKKLALECVATSGSAWIAQDAQLADIPGVRMLSPKKPPAAQLCKIRLIRTDMGAIEAIRREYGCARVVSEFAAMLLAKCRQSTPVR